ncbi:MAG: histidine ammonia-lyase [Cyanobacteria bacterium NC_groundwater_1444_Ag_S-0.65um_54_12]|nr:histidine ammonia-lyase [Cyanobacteria bacterium NC_groundwater_1444_Ag_S-0.65um_54_12]
MTHSIRQRDSITVGGEQLTVEEVVRVARFAVPAALHPACQERVAQSRRFVEELIAEGQAVYGVTTGFGALKDRRIPPHAVADLQQNLIRSHASGVGKPLSREVVRAMLLLRANALAKGASGVRIEIIERLLDLLNCRLHPVIPSQGSVGASGDLAPLAHMALSLVGEGWLEREGELLPAGEALAQANLSPIRLGAKEGLALINGTQLMTAIGCLVLCDAKALAKLADIACAMSLDACLGSSRPFLPYFQELRPHPGQLVSARNLLRLLADSEIFASHVDCNRVQDCYSLRCAPQVHGASRDTFSYAHDVLKIEINAVTDNPLIFPERREVLTGGHFHGQPVALAMDFCKIALAELANISERRIERLVNHHYSNGLPAFLTSDGGLNSGYMLAQYTAAALVSENKVLAHPAAVDSIPTGAGQEDHVSMGTIAARQAQEILSNVQQVLAIELVCGAQGLDFRRPLRPGVGSMAAYEAIREIVPRLGADRPLWEDWQSAVQLVRDGGILQKVEAAVGSLD